eukprot:TRINITY_DN12055_c0_g1_i1.p1 TRINITY_DN12055_c0_g1~~TRINITY_DN12055_c0_g1_i1.p1  ORF type:complete len:336 (+),score=68.37 TRINITY_DN12055_c0_g1_i1:1425-2432(+)
MRFQHARLWMNIATTAFSAQISRLQQHQHRFAFAFKQTLAKEGNSRQPLWLNPLVGASIATGLYGGLYNYMGVNSSYRQDRLAELRKEALRAIKANRMRELKELLQEARRLGDVELKDMMGRSLLSVAGSLGKLQPFKAILDAGADPHSRDKHGLSVLEHAVWKNQEFVVEHLLSVCRISPNDAPDVFGLYSLHKASGYGNCQVIWLLLNHGAEINQRTGDVTAPPSYEAKTKNETPLSIASRLGFHGAMRALLEHPGCQVNIQDNQGDTCLHHACRKGDWRAVEILMNNGAEVNIRNKKGETCADAAKSGALKMAVATRVARLYPTKLLAWMDV